MSKSAVFLPNSELKTMHSPPFIVAIVGCGLGGLAAAIGIRQAGYRVIIFEQAATLSEVRDYARLRTGR